MLTPLGVRAVVSRARAAVARLHADRALRVATALWVDDPLGESGRHAVAADDAAFLADAAARAGRHHEVKDLLDTARRELDWLRGSART